MTRTKKIILLGVVACFLGVVVVFSRPLFKKNLDSDLQKSEHVISGITFSVPVDWRIIDTKDTGIPNEKIIAAKSPDFTFTSTGNEFPPSGIIEKGYQLNIWVQQPTNIKSFDDLVAFYKLGSEGHIVQEEKIVTWKGRSTLRHKLGDYKAGQLFDLHTLVGDRWVTISFSAPAAEVGAEALFDQLLSSMAL